MSVITAANERSKTRAQSGIVIASAARPVIALLLRICFAVATVWERLGHPEREDDDDRQPDVDRADAVDGEAGARRLDSGGPWRRQAVARRRRGRIVVRLTGWSSSLSLHRRDERGARSALRRRTRPRCGRRAGRRRGCTSRQVAEVRRGDDDRQAVLAQARRSGRRSRRACRCRRPRSARTATRISGSRARQRAMTTFCWLPPLSVEIGASGPAATTPRRRVQRSTTARSAPPAEAAAPAEAVEDRQRQVLARR